MAPELGSGIQGRGLYFGPKTVVGVDIILYIDSGSRVSLNDSRVSPIGWLQGETQWP